MNPGSVNNDFSVVATGFLNQIKDDPRIGPTHVSLFMAILQTYRTQEFKSPIYVFNKDLIKIAKISDVTCRKCIRQLHEFGYIKYIPSYYPLLGSLIYLLKLDKE